MDEWVWVVQDGQMDEWVWVVQNDDWDGWIYELIDKFIWMNELTEGFGMVGWMVFIDLKGKFRNIGE